MISKLPKSCEKSKDTFWKLAKEVNDELHGKNFTKNLSFIVYLFDKLAKKLSVSKEPYPNLGRDATCPFNISNRGYFQNFDKSFGPYTLLGTYWATAEHEKGFVHAHNIVSFNKSLFWSIVYYPHVSHYYQVQGYAECIQNHILNAIQ